MAHAHTNRLAAETSPYLLQHQHNPVDWYPWGEEAFAAAREQNKPIFLSVGYSTCYWCHVMERQCFENEAIAALMNERFINIKVDREERPDVDQLYMTAVQVMTRQGGWPMSVFLLNDRRPFYGGTYFPPTDAYGRPGFPTLLRGLSDACQNRRNEVERSARQLVQVLQQLTQPPAPAAPLRVDDALVASLLERSTADYDARDGGFGPAPKFPRQTLLELLLIANRYQPDPQRMAMLTHTLDEMARGGIRDQLGGGFHRYSTDAHWLVPHFEIMLYDNAMLGWCYAEAFAQTGDPVHAAVARGIFDFVLREMRDPSGGFYTALDAEVDGQEGLNYLWTGSQVREALVAALGDQPETHAKVQRFSAVYGLDEGPNFADPHHGNGDPDKNILHLFECSTDVLLDPELAALREILLTARKRRQQPLLDTKIITSWNALMIRALAHGSVALNEPRYLEAASAAADFLLQHHRGEDGSLRRTSRDGTVRYAGFLDDYAFAASALLVLHEATNEPRWKEAAWSIADSMLQQFGDSAAPGLFFSGKAEGDLIVRQKLASDSPLPSGNAVAAMALLQLGQSEAAGGILAAFAAQVEQHGEGMSAMVQAMLLYLQEHEPFTVSAAGVAAIGRPISPQQQAQRVVRMRGEWNSPTSLVVHLQIQQGFHINAHQTAPPSRRNHLGRAPSPGNPGEGRGEGDFERKTSLDLPNHPHPNPLPVYGERGPDHGQPNDAASEAGLIGTSIAVAGDAAAGATVDYPPAQLLDVAFADAPIPIYSGEVPAMISFPTQPRQPVRVTLTYQACTASACLPPASVTVEVPPPLA